jgi:hypothetical protein
MKKKGTTPVANPPRIWVTGDVVREVEIYRGDREQLNYKSLGTVNPLITETLGGARLLFGILQRCLPSYAVRFGLRLPQPEAFPQYLTSHTLYGLSDAGFASDNQQGKESPVWRVERTLGYGLSAPADADEPHLTAVPLLSRPRVIVIDDGALGFRCERARRLWRLAESTSGSLPDWIVLKMAAPIAQGDLWRYLMQPEMANRLVVVISADELRMEGAALNRGLSWEQTVTDLRKELAGNPVFASLLHCRHLIVNFRREGALWIDRGAGKRAAILFFDPSSVEGDWKKSLADPKSKVYGHLSVFTASIVLALAETGTVNFGEAIRRGIQAARCLRLAGYGTAGAKPGFPFPEIVKVLKEPEQKDNFAEALVPGQFDRMIPDEFWTIAAHSENPHDAEQPLFALAHQVAVYGTAKLKTLPHARFGTLLTVDRAEMETLRGLRLMIQAYTEDGPQKPPLSIGAFGPPGAGKSTGIKQIIYEIFGKDVPLLEFNLSQFSNSEDLIGAFHQIRDKALQGCIPVVFWDEFDSREYAWLQFLLAPMQDGKFQSGQLTHNLGKCIFVFAGATSHDFDHFGPMPAPQTAQEHRDRKKRHRIAQNLRNDKIKFVDFVLKKGPDFISRLDGHINVLGPNQRLLYNFETCDWDRPDTSDVTFPVRRAFALRFHLKIDVGKTLDIDRDLLRALLLVPRYRHGMRSLEKIIKPMFQFRAPYRRSHLPPPQVLHQHFETLEAFESLYHAARPFQSAKALRRLAGAISENYERVVAAQNKTPRTDLNEKKFLAGFDALGDWSRATNLAAASRIPYVLALAGLQLENSTAKADKRRDVVGHLRLHRQVLSEEEHKLWTEFHEMNDWRYLPAEKMAGKRKDNFRRRHSLMIDFDQLKFDKPALDYDAIANYPDVCGLVGFRIGFMALPGTE